MCKKYTIDEIKTSFEKKNYQLLSTEYINNKHKLNVKCNKGHIFQIRYDMFINGRGCPVCNETPKYTYSFVKESIENEGYKLLSTEYINSKEKLKIKCNIGHEYETSFYIWNKMKHRCPICAIQKNSNNRKHTYEQVKQTIEKENYKLISTEYINNKHKLDVQCNKGHKVQIRYDIWLRGHRCPICGIRKCAESNRLSFNYIKEQIENKGYKLLSTEYTNNRHKLDIICPHGHKWSVTWNNFKKGSNCNVCSRNDGNHTSKAEKNMLSSIKTFYTGLIIENDKSLIKNSLTGYPLELDIYLPELNKAIEFNSKFYHGRLDQIQRDKEKIIQCTNKNIILLVIDYDEWKKNKENCLNKIKKFILNE